MFQMSEEIKIYSGFNLFKSTFDSLNKNKIKLRLAILNLYIFHSTLAVILLSSAISFIYASVTTSAITTSSKYHAEYF